MTAIVVIRASDRIHLLTDGMLVHDGKVSNVAPKSQPLVQLDAAIAVVGSMTCKSPHHRPGPEG